MNTTRIAAGLRARRHRRAGPRMGREPGSHQSRAAVARRPRECGGAAGHRKLVGRQRLAGAAHGHGHAGQPRRQHRRTGGCSGGAVGKPIDDVAFVKQATESGRKEVDAARDALPQLKNPELKRIAEMLVSDHSNANAKLSKIAESKGWPLPAPQPAAPPASGTASRQLRRPNGPPT